MENNKERNMSEEDKQKEEIHEIQKKSIHFVLKKIKENY